MTMENPDESKIGENPSEVKKMNLDNSESNVLIGLTEELVNLEDLSLSNAGLTTLKGFPKLPNLRKLNLSGNKISSGFRCLQESPKLFSLNLSGNNIKDFTALAPLKTLKCLMVLNLTDCTITKKKDYKSKVFELLTSLQSLDGFDKNGMQVDIEEEASANSSCSEPLKEELMEQEATEDNTKGVKRQLENNGILGNKRMKFSELHSKNALMILNQINPGLEYIVDPGIGPPHDRVFFATVLVKGTEYSGKGKSKKLAKQAAAQAALSSYEQFKNLFKETVSTPDFTEDNFEVEVEHSSKSRLKVVKTNIKKNPIMILNELHPGLTFKLLSENCSIPSQRFRMGVEVNGEIFEGAGQNKRLAKAATARLVLNKVYDMNIEFTPTQLPLNEIDSELFNVPRSLPDKIAKLVMETFNEVTSKLSSTESAKWKVISGIVMTKDEAMEDITVIGFGTGTKCISGEHMSLNGATLNDCHAEVISRRCFKDFLYSNLEMVAAGDDEKSIFQKGVDTGLCLREHIKFHLYISTAPCGDARVFCPHEAGFEQVDKHPNRRARGILRTKIESGEGTIPVKRGQEVQTWDGILPGQVRLLTMSCSDKVASWNILGLQGALLSHFINPIYLESIVLGGLFNPVHLHRALLGRIENAVENLPDTFKLNKPKMCSVSSPEGRDVAKAPNVSYNWTVGNTSAELVNSITGKLDDKQLSRLSKRSFFQRFINLYGKIPSVVKQDGPCPSLYANAKKAAHNYDVAQKQAYLAFAKANLGSWVKKPVEQNEFELSF